MHVLNILVLLYMESYTVSGIMMGVLVYFVEFTQGILYLVSDRIKKKKKNFVCTALISSNLRCLTTHTHTQCLGM